MGENPYALGSDSAFRGQHQSMKQGTGKLF